jgi:hypothetical protein
MPDDGMSLGNDPFMKTCFMPALAHRAALLAFTLILSATSPAHAWKPVMHVYLAEKAREELLQGQGSIGLQKVDFWGQRVTGELGTFPVSPEVYTALRDHPAYYRAGTLGPDAYPDIVFGQETIHPDTNDAGPIGGADAWLRQLYQSARTPQERAFVLGFIAHAVGDMFAHTLVNEFAGGPYTPGDNALRHMVAEGYVGTHTPPMPASAYTIETADVNGFIYAQLIDAHRSRDGQQQSLAWRLTEGTWRKSLPGNFTRLREGLKDFTDAYYQKRRMLLDQRDHNQRLCGRGNLMACYKAQSYAGKLAVHDTLSRVPVLYAEAWIGDIERGLREWPATSTAVARALLLREDRTMDLGAANEVLTRYVNTRLCSMLGVSTAGACAIHPDFEALMNATVTFDLLRPLKEELFPAMVRTATGQTVEHWKNVMSPSAATVDTFLPRPAGSTPTSEELNALMGRHPLDASTWVYDPRKLAPAYNTLTGIKLSFLTGQDRWRSLLQQAGFTPEHASWLLGSDFTGQLHLDFIRSMDGDNQWMGVASKHPGELPGRRMRLAQDPAVFATFFMQQHGDTHNRANRRWFDVAPAGGTLLGDTTTGKVYVVHDGATFHLPTPDWFGWLGLNPADVRAVSSTYVTNLREAPVGVVDTLTAEGVVKGWTFDADVPGQAVWVHVYIDGPAGVGLFAGGALTTVDRPDINLAFSARGVTGPHGFALPIPGRFHDGQQHTAYVYALDNDSDHNPLLNGLPLPFQLRPTLLLHHGETQRIALWHLQGMSVADYTVVTPPLAAGWTVVGAGDFNQDGEADLALQNTVHQRIALWMRRGSGLIAGPELQDVPEPGWQVTGVGMFDSGLSPGLVLQNASTGSLRVWLMNGATRVAELGVDATPPPGWRVAGVGDLDGDHRSDLVLQEEATGRLRVWLLHGVSVVAQLNVSHDPGAGWKLAGVGDLSADGRGDILLQNQWTGQVGVWKMGGALLQAGEDLNNTPGEGWRVVDAF